MESAFLETFEDILFNTNFLVSEEDLSAFRNCDNSSIVSQKKVKISERVYLKALESILNEDSHNKIDALDIIQQVGNREDIAYIASALTDKDSEVRRKALSLMEHFSVVEFIDEICSMIDDENSEVSETAEQVFVRLYTVPFFLRTLVKEGTGFDLVYNALRNNKNDVFDFQLSIVKYTDIKLPEKLQVVLKGKTGTGVLFPRKSNIVKPGYFVFQELPAGEYVVFPDWAHSSFSVPSQAEEILDNRRILAASGTTGKRRTFVLQTDNPYIVCTLDIDSLLEAKLYITINRIIHGRVSIEYRLIEKDVFKSDVFRHVKMVGKVALRVYKSEMIAEAYIGRIPPVCVKDLNIQVTIVKD